MPEALHSALFFLINTVFSLYLFILVVRIILAFVGANYFDPVTQFTVKATNFIVKPLRRLIPNFWHIEFSSLLIVFVLEVIKFFINSLLSHIMPNIFGLLILACADTIGMFIQAFIYGILLQVILSWIQPMSPISHVLYQFVSPIMRPLHRVVPMLGGIDITPIPAIILLQLLTYLIVNPLMALGMGVALG